MTAFYLVESQQIIVNSSGKQLKIRPQSYRIFSLLLDHKNNVVSRDHILKTVWGSTAVTDDSITQCIADIRRILGSEHRHLLQTLPKKGYRLFSGSGTNSHPVIAKSETIPEGIYSNGKDESIPYFDKTSDSGKPSPKEYPQTRTTPTRLNSPEHRRKIFLSLTSVLVFVIFLSSLLITFFQNSFISNINIAGTHSPTEGQRNLIPSIAVLPFQNLTGASEYQYLADGTTEDLITDLSTLNGLLVISRMSTSAYKNRAVNNQSIANELDVRYLLSGSVRRSGTRIRINVEISDALRHSQLWADRFDGEIDSIFDMHDKINQSVVKALALKLSLPEQQRLKMRPTDNLQAYNYYQLGRSYTFSNQRELGNEYLRKAIDLDPKFSSAYAALAYSRSVTVSFGQTEDKENELDSAFRLATKAVSLDNNSAEAHVVLAQTFLLRAQLQQAKKATERAMRSNPSFAPAFGMHAWTLTLLGEPDAALNYFSQAMRLQPTSNGVILSVLGATYYIAERYEEAVAVLEESIAANPNSITTRAFLAATYQRLGRSEDAVWEAEELLALNADFIIKNWRWIVVYADQNDPNFQRLITDLQSTGLTLE